MILLLLLAACGTNSVEPSVQPVQTAVLATKPALHPVTPVPTATIAPTATPLPTATPAPTATAALTAVPTAAPLAPPTESATNMVAPPVGLIYRVPLEGIYRLDADGQPVLLLDEAQASLPNLRLSPNGRYAAYINEAQQLWLIDTEAGEQAQLIPDAFLANFLLWGNETTLLVGVWLDPSEGEGPNNGHIATLDVAAERTLTILDSTRLSSHRPALAPDARTVAFDLLPTSAEDQAISYLYHPASGVEAFDAANFSPTNSLFDGVRFNPTWSPSGEQITWLAATGERVGLQLFELTEKTAVQLFDWDPARFGGLIPSPIWSPDGRWLSLEVWANGPEGSGLWLIASDGSSQTLIDAQGSNPFWLADSQQLLFSLNAGPRLYDVASGQTVMLDLPLGSQIIGFAQN